MLKPNVTIFVDGHIKSNDSKGYNESWWLWRFLDETRMLGVIGTKRVVWRTNVRTLWMAKWNDIKSMSP